MPPTVKSPTLCIFDLDGTLVDSLQDIAEALNECLELLGLAPRPIADYRHMVGEGIPKLCQRAVGAAHPHLVNRLAELARARYRVRQLRHTRPFAGVPELLDRLGLHGVRLAVLSNKPHEMTRTIVHAFWPENTFACVQGYVEEEFRKPDPHYLRRISEEVGASAAETCLIGDTPTDIETARRGGVRGVGVTWGFRLREDLAEAGADCVIDEPAELLTALGFER